MFPTACVISFNMIALKYEISWKYHYFYYKTHRITCEMDACNTNFITQVHALCAIWYEYGNGVTWRDFSWENTFFLHIYIYISHVSVTIYVKKKWCKSWNFFTKTLKKNSNISWNKLINQVLKVSHAYNRTKIYVDVEKCEVMMKLSFFLQHNCKLMCNIIRFGYCIHTNK